MPEKNNNIFFLKEAFIIHISHKFFPSLFYILIYIPTNSSYSKLPLPNQLN